MAEKRNAICYNHSAMKIADRVHMEPDSSRQSTLLSRNALVLCAAGALAMSFGWGFRGDYGHEAGAMVPGALAAMAVCLSSGRPEWFRRCAVMGACGAAGWAFGGQMSYGQVTSYTVSDSFPDVAYGYTCLFIIGMLWGGLGGGLLAFGLTWSRSLFSGFIRPVLLLALAYTALNLMLGYFSDLSQAIESFGMRHLHDTDWLPAMLALLVGLSSAALYPDSKRPAHWMVLLALGWWLGYLLLVQALDLHMSPSIGGKMRSDNWAGCVGMWVAMLLGLRFEKNRAGLMLSCYGALAGGYGFALGDFINKPDKVQWPPFYAHEWLRGFDHWKWTEQSFGLMMGLGVALGLLRLLRGNLYLENDNTPDGARLNDASGIFLWMVIPALNFQFNLNNNGAPTLFGLSTMTWSATLAILAFAILGYALYLHRMGVLPVAAAPPAAKGLLLLFLLMYASLAAVTQKSWANLGSKGGFFIYASFWATVLLCTFLVLSARPVIRWSPLPPCTPKDSRWRLGWRHGLLWGLLPPVIVAITAATMAMQHQPDHGANLRFGPNASHLQTANP